MKFRSIPELLIVLIACSCSLQTSKVQLPTDSGLRIENSINRGVNYTDSLGTDYNLRYIPITIINDSTCPVHIEIAFSKEYNYPHPDSDEKFRLIPLPQDWALDGVEISEIMLDELPTYIEKPVLNVTIESGEKIILAIGTLYSRPAKTTGVLPRTLFIQSDTTNFSECDWHMEKDPSPNSRLVLGLNIIFGERCMIIPCGQISYLKN